MNQNVLGAQILKFRKAAGLTQEELGRAAGVSTQAVSRWECGGTPDISLLPVIADRLGVTIDDLFGREGGENLDVRELVVGYFNGLPEAQILEQLNRLVWDVVCRIPFDSRQEKLLPYLQSCIRETGDTADLRRSNLEMPSGTYFGVAAEDMSFSTICPRPEGGYQAYFGSNDAYRSLFALLAAPGCLEIITYMASRKPSLYVAEALASKLAMQPQTVSQLLEQMTELGLLGVSEVMLPGGLTKAYDARTDGAYVPFLYLARCLMHRTPMYYLNFRTGAGPLL